MANSVFNQEYLQPHKHIRLPGKRIHIYHQVSSTNHVAREMAMAGAPEGTVVMSRFQSGGRGRMQRQWVCPPGQGLLLSMVLRPQIRVESIPWLTLLGAVVTAEAIFQTTGCSAGIKWPNDILIDGQKVCGILAEGSFSSRRVDFVIIGFGINVNLNPAQLPPDCKYTSTSLYLETGRRVSRMELLKQFMVSWDEHYQNFTRSGSAYVRSRWIDNNVTLGRQVTIKKEQHVIQGVAADISDKGALIISLPDGTQREFLAEDISLRG